MRALRCLLTLLMAGGTWLTAPAAHASNDLGVRMPDGTPMYLYRNDLTTGFFNAVEWVRQNDINPTDLTTLYASSISTAYVNIVDLDYGATGWYGLYDCATGPNSGVCDRGDVIFNLHYSPPDGSWSAQDRRSLACEEIGHAMGLAHRYPTPLVGCMAQQWDETDYTAHDVSHLNSWY